MNYREKNILGVNIADVTLENIVSIIEGLILKPGKKSFFYFNPQTSNLYESNNAFKKAIDHASFIYPDGTGILIASKILKKNLRERTTLMDFVFSLLSVAEKRKWSLYILGGTEDVSKKVRINLKEKFPKLAIYGRNGYVNDQEEKVILDINKKKPTILFVAMGMPMQEIWIDKHIDEINARAFFAVGGSVDIIAGFIPRAPVWVRQKGFEWLYRVYKEPKRLWKRYLTNNTVFLSRVFIEFIRKIL